MTGGVTRVWSQKPPGCNLGFTSCWLRNPAGSLRRPAGSAYLAHRPLCKSLPQFQAAGTCFDFFYLLFIWVCRSSLQRVESSSQHVGSWLQRVGSVAVVRGLSHSSARGILVPGPRIETVSLALQGRFLTTGPPWKSVDFFLKSEIKN